MIASRCASVGKEGEGTPANIDHICRIFHLSEVAHKHNNGVKVVAAAQR